MNVIDFCEKYLGLEFFTYQKIFLNQILSRKRIYPMSVLVKNWNLPDMCLVCPFFSGQGCKATMKLFPDWVNVATRPTGCPLSEYYEPLTYTVAGPNIKL